MGWTLNLGTGSGGNFFLLLAVNKAQLASTRIFGIFGIFFGIFGIFKDLSQQEQAGPSLLFLPQRGKDEGEAKTLGLCFLV